MYFGGFCEAEYCDDREQISKLWILTRLDSQLTLTLSLDGLSRGRLIHHLFIKGYEFNSVHRKVVMKQTPLGIKPRLLTLRSFYQLFLK